MAKCKLCKKEIPEGTEYCSDCLDKKQIKSNESYLDSLLNSVKNSSESTVNTYRKSPTVQAPQNSEPIKEVNLPIKEERTSVNEIPTRYPDMDYLSPEDIDPEDLADYDRFDINDDLEDMIVIGDDELYGRDTYEAFPTADLPEEEEDIPEYQASPEVPEVTMSDDNSLEQRITQPTGEEQPVQFRAEPGTGEEFMAQLAGEEHSVKYNEEQAYGFVQTAQSAVEPGTDDTDPTGYNRTEDAIADLISGSPDASLREAEDHIDPEVFRQNESSYEDLSLEPEEDFDPSLGDLLSGFDIPEGDGNEITEDDRKLFGDMNLNGKNPDIEDENPTAEEDDFLSLLSQFSSDDPVGEDVQAITDMLNGNTPVVPPVKNMPSDVGDVFSDALKAVSGLDDEEYDDAIFDKREPQTAAEKEVSKKGKKAKKSKKAKATKKPGKKAKTVRGKGLFGKLFGNVVDEEARKAAAKEKTAPEETAAAKETKKPKGKKAKKDTAKVPQEAEGSGRREIPAEGEEKKTEAKGKKKEKVKKPKKEKKEIIELIDDYDGVEGRINRLGASIVFLFFGIMVILLLVGTNLFTYSVSIKNANTYFNRHKYTDAYNEVYGIELKDEDIELYDKIETVMFVNKQLNSYNNYYAMKKYPEALDSLLKGLKRYDKYIELATALGIKSDLDYVRDQILAELNHVFRLSEQDAVAILDSDSQKDYSVAIYDVVLENLNY